MALFSLDVKTVHIFSVDNRIPDLLSRWDTAHKYRAEFKARTRELNLTEIEIVEQDFEFLF